MAPSVRGHLLGEGTRTDPFCLSLGEGRQSRVPGLDNGDNPSEEHAAEGGDPGGGSGGWCCLQAVFPAGLVLAALAGG